MTDGRNQHMQITGERNEHMQMVHSQKGQFSRLLEGIGHLGAQCWSLVLTSDRCE